MTQEYESSLLTGTSAIEPLMTPDLGYGVFAALVLAAFASYLQSLRSQNDFILAPLENLNSASENATAFADWKEISRLENFVLFKKKQARKIEASYPVELRWVLFALLLLFTPIFSFEFFLTVSRQLLCAWNQEFCEPYLN